MDKAMNVPFYDTFSNFLSGLGVPGRDKMASFRYVKPVWSRDQLEASFSSDWIARKAIVIPAEDSTREWRSWQAEADQIEKLEETEARLGVQLKLQTALIKARLYGGCCILLGVDGDMTKELDTKTIKKDGLKFIHILAPHQVTIEELVKDISNPFYGQPEFYTLVDDQDKFRQIKIHPSRMIRLTGLEPPDPLSQQGWGDPVLGVIHDAVAGAGTVAQSIATLIAEAKFDVVKIPGLTEIFSTTAGTTRLIKRFSEANVAKSVINAVVLDAEEEWERIGVQFNGMPEILQMYMQIAAGAADIPATRFLGMSPAGLSATGESDLRNYYDRIASDQELRLTPALERLDHAIIMSSLGKFDEEVWYEWRSLWQVSDGEKAEIAAKKANTAKIDADTGLVPFEALVKGRVNQLIEDGTYPGLEQGIDEAIEAEELMREEQEAMAMQAELDPANQNLPPEEEGGAGFGDRADPFSDKDWREELHPRDPGGEGGGQFTSGGASGASSEASSRRVRATRALAGSRGPRQPRSAGFVSPSVKTGLDLKGAERELESRQQLRLRLASTDINRRLGLEKAKEVDIIGLWKDPGAPTGAGAENSIMSRSNAGWDHTVLATVMKGHLADQKAILVFEQDDEGGGSTMSRFEAKGDLKAIHKGLLKDGLENHTVIPNEAGDGATIVIVDFDGSSAEAIKKGASRYGDDNPIHVQFGQAKLIGDTEDDVGAKAGTGSDREQRDRARKVYESYINRSPVPNAKRVWKDVRNYWGAPSEKAGYKLTPQSLISDHPNIKKNSVVVTEAAKMINERAGKILQEELGVSKITEDNHTEETDDYLANVIAMELREGLISGASGEHWYDNTIKQAMHIAEEIYPGVRTDPRQRFMYTAALAITSQGETVDRNVALADEAYEHYRATGQFPTDLKVKKPSVLDNFRKMNEFIAEYGGGDKGIDKLRKFFNKEMTARELFEATNVEPGQTLKDDMVYGSAMLGPKIGNGFFQNLNGNFKPITMDLWFMRAWGRITNTGVSDKGYGDQMETYRTAMAGEGRDVPANDDEAIVQAQEVLDQHERDYKKYRAEFNAKTRVKSKSAHAAERLMIAYKGAMVEAPKNGNQRKWITSVFRKALGKLAKQSDLHLTPAGAQATWWWPEKILWEEMGVTGKKRDTDYLKSLIALRDKKRGTQ
jgi:phage-related protein (TIGR01555 family)